MEQKAEELYGDHEDGSCGAHPRPQFSADECGEMVLKQKPVMFWKQSEGFKGSSEQERPILPTFLFKLKPYWTRLL